MSTIEILISPCIWTEFYLTIDPLPPTPEDLYETAAPAYEDLDMIRANFQAQEDLYMEAVDGSAVWWFHLVVCQRFHGTRMIILSLLVLLQQVWDE